MPDFSALVSQVFRPDHALFELLPRLTIAAVEVTQAIQYSRAAEHLTDPADRGPDNSLTLVADKPACVRVCVQGTFFDVPDVGATVVVQRRKRGLWVDNGTLTQLAPSSVTAWRDAPYSSERGVLQSTLNFLVPGDVMRGELRFKVHVGQHGEGALGADKTVVVHATLRQTLRLRGVPVRYWGPDAAGNQVQLAAPTLADFVAECGWTCNAWPVSPRPDVSLAGTFTWSNPLTGNMANGSCPTSWSDLLFWLRLARVLDGDRPNSFYYALLPNGVPIGDTGGCGNPGGVGAGFVGGNGGTTIAHELGHVLGFDHVFGNLPADDDRWDRSYPAYEPYDTPSARNGTIGEYGFDVTTWTVMSPAWATDFMGYGSNPWMSPHHHRLMIENARLNPEWVPLPADALPPMTEVPREWTPLPPNPPDPPWGRVQHVRPLERQELVLVAGRQVDGRLEMSHVLQVHAFVGVEGLILAGTSVELLDAEGRVIARAPVYQLPTTACGGADGCGCGGAEPRETLLHAKVPAPAGDDAGRVTAVRVVRDGDEVWRREAPGHPPRVSELEVAADGDRLRARWTTQVSDDAVRLDRFVRWSGDDGRTWHLLALGVDQDELDVPTEGMTPGEAIVQVLVTDGFSTTASDGVRVEVPARPPTVSVMWPRTGAVVAAGMPLRLWGSATAADGRPLDGDSVTWLVDGERVAIGADQWVALDLAEGEHRATLRAEDGRNASEVEVVFEVRTRLG